MGWHRHQARYHLQGGRQHPEESEGRREHLHEQLGHPGGAGQEPQGLDQDGRRQRTNLDELSRKLGVQEDELKRAIERAELAENKLKSIEEELQMVGENMKSLE